MEYQKPTVIAEIGCVHVGKIDRAKKLINLAKLAGANIVKLQKRNPIECVPKKLRKRPHNNKDFAYGETYLKHRENIELDVGQHYELKQHCESINIEYSTSVFDITSAEEIIQLNPKYIKIPSCCNTHWKLIDTLLNKYKGDIHISLGMTTADNRDDIARYLSPYKDRIVVYLCTSKYPAEFKDLHLMELNKMKKIYNRIGYSGHHYGISIDIAAYTLGATYIEGHFIDDRCFPHTDARASIEPQGLNRLCRNLENTYKAMTFKPYDMDEEEFEQAQNLRYYNKE